MRKPALLSVAIAALVVGGAFVVSPDGATAGTAHS
jgi:hypothetical protein